MARIGTLGWNVLGVVSLALGAIGVFLPLLPTTPFVLLAVFAFSKGSPTAAAWLRNHGVFGSVIADWERRGAIAPSIKLFACSMMAASLLGSLYLELPVVALLVQAAILTVCALYILTRPSD